MVNPKPKGDTFLVRGRIHTGNWHEDATTEALWVQNGMVRATGAQAIALGAQGPVWRLEPETCLMPGFWDGHIHLTDYGFSLDEVPLAGLNDAEAVVSRLLSAPNSGSGPLLGRGWMLGAWRGPRPHRSQLDRLGDRPVLLWNHDFHTVWANSAALAQAGIDASTADPVGGRIERDASGQATGLLLDNATSLLTSLWPERTPDRIEQALLQAQDRLLSFGVTAVCTMGEGSDAIRALVRLNARGALRLRVGIYVPLDRWHGVAAAGLATGLGDEYLWLGGVKAFLDGSLGSQTAWMSEPYNEVGGTGIAMPVATHLAKTVTALRAAGLRLSLHAIGDRAVFEAVAVLQGAAPAWEFDRIEHAQLVTPEAIDLWPPGRLAASMQPGHLTDDIELMARFWGAERTLHAFPFRSLRNRGVPLVFGSDAPVSDPNPLKGVWAAAKRRREDDHTVVGESQKLTVAEALDAYTRVPALVEGRPHLGRLTPGSPFTAVLLDSDPLAAGTDLARLTVLSTYAQRQG